MTQSGNWAAVQQLFDDLVDHAPAAREARLARAGLDPGIVAEVRSLLEASDTAGLLDRTREALRIRQ